MEAKIVFYKQDKLDQNPKFRLRRELLGLEQKSNFSRYCYKESGLLDRIPHYRPVDSTMIIENKNLNKVKMVLNKYAFTYETFSIKIPISRLAKK